MSDKPELLAEAWMKYVALFGEPPHGTVQQMAALLELVSRAPRLSPEEMDALEVALDAIVCDAPPGERYDRADAVIRKMLEDDSKAPPSSPSPSPEEQGPQS